MANGTLSVSDLLATQATVVQLGEDRVFESIDIALAAHNAILREKLDTLVEITSDRARRYGGPDAMTMDRVGEFGTGDAQKISAGSRVEFPLYLNEVSVMWTRTYLKNATAKEFAEQFIAAQDADVRAIERDIKTAFFTPTNKTVTDRLVDNMTLSVKALANADSEPIPVAPDGTTFNAATHTHYLYTAGTTLAAADLDALITTVVEHQSTGKVVVYINAAQQTAVTGLTGFIKLTPTFVAPATTAASVVGPYDQIMINNRLIGYYGANYAEVWVKPWVPAGYLTCYVQGALRPLVMRTRNGQNGDLVIAADDENHPLRARTLEREFGIGVYQRVNAAALYIDSGAAGAYQTPTFS